MNDLLSLPLIVGLLAQVPAAPTGDRAAEAKARLQFMKRTLDRYEIRAGDGIGAAFHLKPEPVLRFTNPVGGSKDGAVFLWLDERDRPAVAVQIYWNPSEIWLEELSSLSTGTLIATCPEGHNWNPSRGGISFKPVAGAPSPADTAEARLRQMRELAQGFSAEHFYKARTRNKLRLLAKPLARYGRPDSAVRDGALFCFAHGTDPEVLLLLEAHPIKEGVEWEYALAPLTSFAVNAWWKGEEVWSLPGQANGSARDPRNTFNVRRVPLPADDRLRVTE